jgi:hypothetical protein
LSKNDRGGQIATSCAHQSGDLYHFFPTRVSPGETGKAIKTITFARMKVIT